jgi:hypothetical protein
MAALSTSLVELRQALARGERSFLGLSLDVTQGVDLDLSGWDLGGSSFGEVRFGHAQLGGARIEACSANGSSPGCGREPPSPPKGRGKSQLQTPQQGA